MVVDFFYTCRRWSGEPRRVEVHRRGDLRWFRPDALPETVVPRERVVLEALRAGPVQAILTDGFA
jgi:8-oxo-dGTP diphosphatase